MAWKFPKQTIKVREEELHAIPDYSITLPTTFRIGERIRRNAHPKLDIVAKGRHEPTQLWIGDVVQPEDAENENHDIIWRLAEVLAIAEPTS
ncbi:MAG: hypothetical protein EPN91_07515 [Salinibacterium sp.]|nr:MAG: hypothetical protein EPN91_07515 [Salinibacterium sp.]